MKRMQVPILYTRNSIDTCICAITYRCTLVYYRPVLLETSSNPPTHPHPSSPVLSIQHPVPGVHVQRPVSSIQYPESSVQSIQYPASSIQRPGYPVSSIQWCVVFRILCSTWSLGCWGVERNSENFGTIYPPQVSIQQLLKPQLPKQRCCIQQYVGTWLCVRFTVPY